MSRDRGTEYASASSTGAPQAIQVADRFHVCKNLSEAVQLLLARVLVSDESTKPRRKRESKHPERTLCLRGRMASRPRSTGCADHCHPTRRARCALSAGCSLARARSFDERDCLPAWHQPTNGAEASLRVVWPLIPDPGASERRDFDPYAAYVLKRWHDGERNGTRIFQEIAAASVTQAHNAWYTRFLKTLKRTEVKTSAEIPQVLHDTSTAAVCLFMRHPENLEISPPSGSGGTSPGSSSLGDNVSLDAGLSPAVRANGKGSGSLPG